MSYRPPCHILAVTNPNNANTRPHEYIRDYDCTSIGLREEIEHACEVLLIEEADSKSFIDMIHEKLMNEGVCWLHDVKSLNYLNKQSFCFEKFVLPEDDY